LLRHFKNVVGLVGFAPPEPVLVVIVEDLVSVLAHHADQPVVHGTVGAEHNSLNRTAAKFNKKKLSKQCI